MKKKLISSILALTMAVGTILTGCGTTVTTNITVDSGNEQQSADKASDDGKEAASADASAEATAADDKASADRPGA
ncbi:MAG: hypothetical protein K6E91_02135 [Butyrivibrio sp.]|nr:hypothetical protein [Butyrivibrio sp.]